jgi:hypothetical protein
MELVKYSQEACTNHELQTVDAAPVITAAVINIMIARARLWCVKL